MRIVLILLLAVLASGCNLSAVPATSTPEPAIPSVSFLFPANGTIVVVGTDVQIQLFAQDRTGVGVGRLELLVDEMPLQQATPLVSAAVTDFTVDMNWLATGVGRHVLQAVAYRPDGTPSEPATIILEVIPPAGENPATTSP